VRRRAAPAQVVVVHAGEIVVHQRISVDHLDGRSQLGDGEKSISAGVRADDAVREREHHELGTRFELQLAPDVRAMRASWLTPPELARMIANYDRIVSI